MGRNGVREALRSGRSIDRILVTKEQDGSLGELVNMARDRNIQLREVDRAKLDELCMPFGHGNKPGNHQGIVAQVPGVDYCEVEDILAVAKARGEAPFLILLDGIEDPHNLGSILRSAECAGAHGVILPKRRSASLTAAACKASAGAVEYIKVARVANLVEAMRRLKRQGIWLAGADMQGTATWIPSMPPWLRPSSCLKRNGRAKWRIFPNYPMTPWPSWPRTVTPSRRNASANATRTWCAPSPGPITWPAATGTICSRKA